ncbi:Mg/Co/Ni transporter MgtE [Agromyces flavus]|uniref:Mg/Co/Ni transporter MgtE n=2 Tax=Agromyces flavus TaxID=589382 RepID=A0ABT1KKS5_9MICO|nr:HPP family protein [Agromyces flavus]MCP2367483.1 Mg/Co/Ni transporter MgtE [Agromyces flavus]
MPDREPMSPARRRQLIVGLVVGLIVGIGVSVWTGFWVWLGAGLAVGLAAGAIMKPPGEDDGAGGQRRR